MTQMTQTIAPTDPGEVDAADGTNDALAGAVLDLLHKYNGIKARMVSGPEADQSPVFLLAKLVLGGPKRSGELAAALCADPSTVSRQAAALVKAGLVERQADPEDGRASLLVPTEAGLQRVEQHRERRGTAIAPVVQDWSADDRATFLRLLRRYSAGVETHRDAIVATLARVDHESADTPVTNSSVAADATHRSEGSN